MATYIIAKQYRKENSTSTCQNIEEMSSKNIKKVRKTISIQTLVISPWRGENRSHVNHVLTSVGMGDTSFW